MKNNNERNNTVYSKSRSPQFFIALACGLMLSFFTVKNIKASCSGSVVPTPATCHGLSTGSAIATGSGGVPPYHYTWSTVGGGAWTGSPGEMHGLAAGTYTVTITDSTGCNTILPFTINEPPATTVIVTQVPATSKLKCDGSISITVSGGAAPYTYFLYVYHKDSLYMGYPKPIIGSGPIGTTVAHLCPYPNYYKVQVNDVSGCSSYSPQIDIVLAPY